MESEPIVEEEQKPSAKVITTEMVDSWCKAIKKDRKVGAVRSLLRAFRAACHYGDDGEDDSAPKFSIISSNVFNQIMVFVLNEMDGILRGLLDAPISGGKKEIVMELTTTKMWKKHGSLMRLYLGNALHILTQMTDETMISFTLRRVKASAVFLAAFPSLLRKYVKVSRDCPLPVNIISRPIIFFLQGFTCISKKSHNFLTCVKAEFPYISLESVT